MSAATRYGVQWPDGSFTGGITFSQRDAAAYAKTNDGSVYEVGSAEDPEVMA